MDWFVIIHSTPPRFMTNEVNGEPAAFETADEAEHAAEHRCVGSQACGYTLMDNESQEFVQ